MSEAKQKGDREKPDARAKGESDYAGGYCGTIHEWLAQGQVWHRADASQVGSRTISRRPHSVAGRLVQVWWRVGNS